MLGVTVGIKVQISFLPKNSAVFCTVHFSVYLYKHKYAEKCSSSDTVYVPKLTCDWRFFSCYFSRCVGLPYEEMSLIYVTVA